MGARAAHAACSPLSIVAGALLCAFQLQSLAFKGAGAGARWAFEPSWAWSSRLVSFFEANRFSFLITFQLNSWSMILDQVVHGRFGWFQQRVWAYPNKSDGDD